VAFQTSKRKKRARSKKGRGKKHFPNVRGEGTESLIPGGKSLIQETGTLNLEKGKRKRYLPGEEISCLSAKEGVPFSSP